uniref:WAP domain-containing protein n=1 Tax=Parascaris equorum TaxID=6256 RepID=A0A914RH56_PAREQ
MFIGKELGLTCCLLFGGLPASDINAKAGSCPTPSSTLMPTDTAVGCWLDSGCPGIQKCCVEPNPSTNSAARICRDPIDVSS